MSYDKTIGKGNAEFITAFVADTPVKKGRPSTLDHIRRFQNGHKKTADLPGWLSGKPLYVQCHWQ
jgi:hypothetical protein